MNPSVSSRKTDPRPPLHAITERACGRSQPCRQLPETATPRCPICKGILYVRMGRGGPEFRCRCRRTNPDERA